MRQGLRIAVLAAACTLALIAPAAAQALEPLSDFGEFGGGSGDLNEPAGIAVADDGTAYVADSGNDWVSVFDADGEFVRRIGAGTLSEPAGVALGEDEVYVSDPGNSRVAVFTQEGALERLIVEAGPEPLVEPIGLELDDDLLYVTDYGRSRVAVFTLAGEYVREYWPTLGPTDVALDGLNVAVTSEGSERVDLFNRSSGSFSGAVGGGVLENPRALVAPPGGDLYVADSGLGEVVELIGLAGELGETFAPSEAGGVTPTPHGLALDCRGAFFVTERAPAFARVERFGEPGAEAPDCTPPPLVPVPFAAPPPAIWIPNGFRIRRVRVIRRNGRAVVFVRVFAPGKVFVWGRGIRTSRRGTQRPKIVRVPVKPKRRLLRYLRRRGKARIRINVAFRPYGGIAREPRERPVLLRKKRRRR